MCDFNLIRKDFPVLNQEINGKPVTFLDSAASSQQPYPVIEKVKDFVCHDYSNIHRGLYPLAERSNKRYDEARETVADFIGVKDVPSVIFTRGTTESLNLLAYTWGERNIQENDEIVIPIMEHHSNLVPWQQLALRKNAKINWVEINKENGTLDMDSLDKALSGNPKLLTFAWVSNVFGTINPVKEIAAKAKEKGAVVVLDGAQGVPHLPTDVEDLGVDFLAFSGHKMLAPTGIGVLWGRRKLLKKMPPFQFGGSMINNVMRENSTWDILPSRFEAGTPNIVGAIGLAAACDYIKKIGFDKIRQHDHELTSYAFKKMQALEGATVLGPNDVNQRSSVFSFYFRKIHPHDIATILAGQGVCVRAGHHCCQPLMREIGLSGTTRASFYLYNNFEDIDRLIDALILTGEKFSSVNCEPCCNNKTTRKAMLRSRHNQEQKPCCSSTSCPNATCEVELPTIDVTKNKK